MKARTWLVIGLLLAGIASFVLGGFRHGRTRELVGLAGYALIVIGLLVYGPGREEDDQPETQPAAGSKSACDVVRLFIERKTLAASACRSIHSGRGQRPPGSTSSLARC